MTNSHFEPDTNPLALALMFAGTGLAWVGLIVAVGMAVVR